MIEYVYDALIVPANDEEAVFKFRLKTEDGEYWKNNMNAEFQLKLYQDGKEIASIFSVINSGDKSVIVFNLPLLERGRYEYSIYKLYNGGYDGTGIYHRLSKNYKLYVV